MRAALVGVDGGLLLPSSLELIRRQLCRHFEGESGGKREVCYFNSNLIVHVGLPRSIPPARRSEASVVDVQAWPPKDSDSRRRKAGEVAGFAAEVLFPPRSSRNSHFSPLSGFHQANLPAGSGSVSSVTFSVFEKISGISSTPTLKDFACTKAELLNAGSSAIEMSSAETLHAAENIEQRQQIPSIRVATLSSQPRR